MNYALIAVSAVLALTGLIIGQTRGYSHVRKLNITCRAYGCALLLLALALALSGCCE